jgi:hypothetical protein
MSMLSQLRNAHDVRIKFNVSLAQWFVCPMKDNGFGEMIPNLDVPPTIAREAVRVSHEASSVPSNSTGPTGLSTNASYFVELYWNSVIKENDVIVIDGQGWKIGYVDSQKVQNEVYAKHAPLYRADVSGDSDISSVTMGDVEGVIVGQNVTVTVPAETDVTSIEPVILHTGALIEPTGVRDFTEPVSYTVTAANMTKKIYVITVEVES